MPALTDVVTADEVQPHEVSSVPVQPRAVLAPPPALVAEGVTSPPARIVWAARTPVLVGFGGAAVMLMAAALWSRPHAGAPSPEGDASGAAVAPATPAPAVATTAPALTPATAIPAVLPPSVDAGRSDAIEATREADKPGARATDGDNMARTQPRQPSPPRTAAAAPARAAAARPTPARQSASPECTPQVDALGLCAPGATVTGR
ncbi:MAG TPA: hypothetical protein VFU71_14585 [Burkholderiaceae bacterium]|nr:hypothetical protein [Burkholderiaceae bacterium]